MELPDLKNKFLQARADFPMLKKSMHGKPLIYFDSAATAQKPQAVIDTVQNFYQNEYGTVHRAIYELSVQSTHNYQSVRQKVCAFINAERPEEIIFTRGTTESINFVAYSFGKAFVKPGDEIMISEIEHHSNIVPWQILCEDRGAVLKVIPVNDRGEISPETVRKMITDKTKLVSIAHVSNALGTIHPVKEIIEIAHKAGAKVLIDGAQSAPHLPIDVQDLDADFYVFSGHKVYGPTGIGILYGKEALLAAMPPPQGGGDMIERVDFSGTTYASLPLKFEAGTPMIAQVLGLGSAIEYVSALGMDQIKQWEHVLLEHGTEKMQQIPGLRIIGTAKEKGAIISFTVEGVHPLDIGTLLDLRGIAIRTGHHCAQPAMRRFGLTGTARASFAFYNQIDEIDQFVENLKEVIKALK